MIRRAIKEDADKIAEILSQTLTKWSEQSVVSSIEKDFCLVAEKSGVCGAIFLSRVLDECEILNFAVDTNLRGSGIGTVLLDAALSDEFVKGADVFLDVRESNEAAIHLYKKFGFKEITVRKNFYTNPNENAIIMKK